jgi:hypothetical protein
MRIVSWLVRLAIIVVLVIGVRAIWNSVMHGGGLKSLFSSLDQTETVHTIVLQEITAMGKLELVKYNFKDVVEQEIVKMWLPNAKAVLIVQGEAIGCMDLTKINIADISSEQETLVVHMPEPELCVFKIDHEKSKIYNTEYAFMEEAKLVQDAYKQAEKQIQKSALHMGILKQTEENAAKILTPILEKASGKKVILKFPMHASVEKLR